MNGDNELKIALQNLNIDLSQLIAQTSIWVHPATIKIIQSITSNPNAQWIINCRRKKSNEKRRIKINGTLLDDNTYANQGIKICTNNISTPNTYTTCHIYQDSCYDPNYHTSLCNLVLLPRAISSFSDFHKPIIDLLKYRSYEIYGFYINTIPSKPNNYNSLRWNSPITLNSNFTNKILKHKYRH